MFATYICMYAIFLYRYSVDGALYCAVDGEEILAIDKLMR